jgi:hypothetical protein
MEMLCVDRLVRKEGWLQFLRVSLKAVDLEEDRRTYSVYDRPKKGADVALVAG